MATRQPYSLGDIQRQSPAGGTDSAISRTIYSINHRKSPAAVPLNKDDYGLVFFTRPRLNLSLTNIRHHRYLNQLATYEPSSIQRIIACTLDPRLHLEGTSTPLIDHENCFIPILSNHIESVSGWNDAVIESYTSEAGIAGEQFSMVDSQHEFNGKWQLSTTFRNMTGDLITNLIDYWRTYSSLVAMGIILPYFDLLIRKEIDYHTRPWRLVLDSTKTYVQKIGAAVYAYPVSVPMGRSFDYQAGEHLQSPAAQIDVQFEAVGTMYNDPILVMEFNKIVQTFKIGMRDAYRSSAMKKIPQSLLNKFNAVANAYPRINPASYELEWWCDADKYRTTLEYFVRLNTDLGI